MAATWGEMLVVEIYASPNKNLADLERILDGARELVREFLPRPVLVAGDPNAKVLAWGSPVNNPKGTVLEEWAEELGLEILNRGRALTCVRDGGGSVIDITLGCPRAARMVLDWHVMEGEETLSDHRYIRFRVSDPSMGAMPRLGRGRRSTAPRGWGLKKLDRDLMMAAAIVKMWTEEATRSIEDVDEGAVRLRGILTEVCDASMPRRRALPPKQSVYWWTQELAELRTTCNRARRQ